MSLLSDIRSLFYRRQEMEVAPAPVPPDRFALFRDCPDKLLRSFEILAFEMGLLNTMTANLPVDAENRPLPWYTYPAIEYLRQFDFTDRDIFEFGSGNSSLFWMSLGATVWSVDHNPDWYQKAVHGKMDRHTIYLGETVDRYIAAIELPGRTFDIVVIDGEWRQQCVAPAISRLKPGGFIILDNADRDHDARRELTRRGFFEVDFSGFGPINDYTWTTSLFLPPEGTKLQIVRRPCPIGGHPDNGIGA